VSLGLLARYIVGGGGVNVIRGNNVVTGRTENCLVGIGKQFRNGVESARSDEDRFCSVYTLFLEGSVIFEVKACPQVPTSMIIG